MTGGRRLRVTRIRVTLGVTGEGEDGGQTRNQTVPDRGSGDRGFGALDVILVHVGPRSTDIAETLCASLGCTFAEAWATIKRVTYGQPTLLLRGASQQDARKLVSDLRSKGAAARTDEKQGEGTERPPSGPVGETRARRWTPWGGSLSSEPKTCVHCGVRTTAPGRHLCAVCAREHQSPELFSIPPPTGYRAHRTAYISAASAVLGLVVVLIIVAVATSRPSHRASTPAAVASATSISSAATVRLRALLNKEECINEPNRVLTWCDNITSLTVGPSGVTIDLLKSPPPRYASDITDAQSACAVLSGLLVEQGGVQAFPMVRVRVAGVLTVERRDFNDACHDMVPAQPPPTNVSARLCQIVVHLSDNAPPTSGAADADMTALRGLKAALPADQQPLVDRLEAAYLLATPSSFGPYAVALNNLGTAANC
jgi:hypothetical protein